MTSPKVSTIANNKLSLADLMNIDCKKKVTINKAERAATKVKLPAVRSL